MPYSLVFTDTAEADLSRLDAGIARRVRNAIDRLAENADAVRHTALTGTYSESRFGNTVGRLTDANLSEILTAVRSLF